MLFVFATNDLTLSLKSHKGLRYARNELRNTQKSIANVNISNTEVVTDRALNYLYEMSAYTLTEDPERVR
ncbi:MAG TPA: hypothetical protein VHI78_08165, partial [Bacteroidales bacterium]|nr:hypothetical protein [Bacteroidales bacterium]